MTVSRKRLGLLLAALLSLAAVAPGAAVADGSRPSAPRSAPTMRISGEGSSWAGNALNDWQAAVASQGVKVDYNPSGSSSGRKDFALGLADFAVSEIPYTGDTADPQDTARPHFRYGMLPVVAGGTAFMYNLSVGGGQFQNLKLSPAAIAKIFSGQVTRWNAPIIAKTNPGVALPNQRITVVVRSDGSGATAQFTLWMLRQYPADYKKLCAETGCNPTKGTSYYPYQGLDNFTAQSGSNGVTTYTANTPYTINYDEYSYALGVNFPVAQVQNAAGFYTTPTAQAVAVALTQAKINSNKHSANYLSQDLTNVYPYRDPRSYPLSAYSYMIEPTQTRGNFDTGKGNTLSYFEQFQLCEGQQTMGRLGYSPLPMNLVLAALDQVLKVPGISSETKAKIVATKNGVKTGSGNPCNNPTFKPGDSPAHNVLIDSAPFPAGCDATCQQPWLGRADNNGPGSKTSGKNTGTGDGGGTTGTDSTGPGGSGTDGPIGSGSNAPNSGGAQTCDPDSGICTGSVVSAAGSGDPSATATPYTLAGTSKWGTAQLALVLSVLFVAMLILGPPLAARALGNSGPTRRTSTPPVTAEPPAPEPGSHP